MPVDQRADQLFALGLVEGPGVRQQGTLAFGRAALRDGVNFFALDEDRDDVAGHLVNRVPARPDSNIERTRVDDVVGIVQPTALPISTTDRAR